MSSRISTITVCFRDRHVVLQAHPIQIVDPGTAKHTPLVSDELFTAVVENQELLDAAIIHHRDFNYQ